MSDMALRYELHQCICMLQDFLKAGANVIALDSPSHLHSSHQYIEELEINEEQRCRLQVEIICLVNGGGIKRLASRHTNVNVIINCFR